MCSNCMGRRPLEACLEAAAQGVVSDHRALDFARCRLRWGHPSAHVAFCRRTAANTFLFFFALLLSFSAAPFTSILSLSLSAASVSTACQLVPPLTHPRSPPTAGPEPSSAPPIQPQDSLVTVGHPASRITSHPLPTAVTPPSLARILSRHQASLRSCPTHQLRRAPLPTVSERIGPPSPWPRRSS